MNYRTAELVIDGVNSVLRCDHGGRDVSVHVVDNASPDNSAAVLSHAHATLNWKDRVTLYLEPENHGFGRGNNLVLRALAAQAVSPDAVFLLNPDARLENEAIDLLASALEVDPKAGFAGAGIAKPGGESVTAAFRFPSAIGEFSRSLNFGPVTRALKRWEVPLPPDHSEGVVDWVAGAAVLIRMSAVQELGGFDPRFFLYYEEIDLMRRGQKAGWHSLFVPRARIVHIEGEATGVKSGAASVPRVPGYRYDSWQYYFRKTHGQTGALLAALSLIVGSVGGRALSTLRGRPCSVPSRFFRDFWRHALRPLLQGRA